MRASKLLLALLCAAVAAADVGPLSQVRTKDEAARAFAGVETTLMLKSGSTLRPLFQQWQRLYNIQYTAAEEPQRYATFVANVRRIIAINKDTKTSHWAGLTKFAAMTPAEARSSLLSPSTIPPVPKPTAPAAGLKSSPPASKDWAAEGMLTPVKDQGSCGSCWAFTGVAAVEAQVKIQTGAQVDLSEQQLIDCHPTAWACWGGWLDATFSYAASTPLVPDSVYPYTVGGCVDPADGNNTCFENRCPTSPQVCRNCRVNSAPAGPRYQLTGTGFGRSTPGSKTDLQQAVANGPTAVAMLVDDDFWLYSGGIYTKPEGTCGATTAVDHAVLAVGYDSTGATPYWKIRNTWGSGWGEGGYFRMSMEPGNVGPCQIYVYGGYYPTAVNVTNSATQWSTSAPLRLVRGAAGSTTQASLIQGRLEVQHSGAWGTVCSGSFTRAAASVACRQMGKGSVGYAAAASVYGSAAAAVSEWMGGVSCTGSEARLQDCAFPGWGKSTCSHTEDVGVYCGYFKTRLVYAKGTPAASRNYRVEAQFNGMWGSLCATSFTATDAGVVCRSAGLGSAGRVVQLSASSRPRAGAASQKIWLASPGCLGSEAALQQCPLPGLVGKTGCPADHSADVGVQCYTPGGTAAPLPIRTKALRPAIKAVKA